MSRAQSHTPMSKGGLILMTLIASYLLFFSATVNELTAFIAIALMIVFSAAVLRSRLLSLLVGIPAALSFLSTTSFIPVASLASVIFFIGMGAVSLLRVNKLFAVGCFLIAFGASVLITGDPIASAVMLPFVLCAVLLAIALAKGMRRAPAICLVASGLLVGYVLIITVAIYRLGGQISTELLAALVDEAHAIMLEAFRESVSLLEPEMRALMTEEVFNAAFDTMLCTLPAGCIIAISVIAFLAHLLSFMLSVATGYAEKIPEESRPFVLSPVTAVLYVVSFLLMLFAPYMGDSSGLLLLTAQNMTLILMPALLLVGVLGIYGFLVQSRGCLNIWAILGIILIAFYTRGILLYPISFIGVYLTFRVNKQRPLR